MKKIIATVLALMMVLSLVACGAGEEKKDPTNGGNTVENNETPAPAGPTDKELADAASVEEIAKALINKYAEFAGVRETYDQYMAEMPEEEQISYEEFLSYQMAVNPVDPEYLMGFGETQPTGYSEAYVYQPMMMGTAFIGYIFRVAEGTDVEAFKKSLTDNCDPRWNICTMANTTVCENFENLVYFTMMVVADEENPFGFSVKQKDAFYQTFLDTIKGENK